MAEDRDAPFLEEPRPLIVIGGTNHRQPRDLLDPRVEFLEARAKSLSSRPCGQLDGDASGVEDEQCRLAAPRFADAIDDVADADLVGLGGALGIGRRPSTGTRRWRPHRRGRRSR